VFSFLKKQKSKQPYYIILDIGPQKLVGVVFCCKKGKALIKCLIIKQSENLTGQFLENCLQDMLNEFSSYNLKQPIKAVVCLGQGIVRQKITKMGCVRENPKKKITNTQANNIKQTINEEIIKNIKKTEVGPYVLDSELLLIQIDNKTSYDLAQAVGKQIDLTYLHTYMPTGDYNNLQSLLKQFRINPVVITSTIFWLTEAVDKDAIYIELKSDVTQIAVRRKGITSGIRLLSLGESDLINEPVLWVEGIFTALEGFEMLPCDIFLSSEQNYAKKALKLLKGERWPKFLPFAKKKKFKIMCLDDLSNIIDETGQLDKPQYLSTLSLAGSVLKH